jgi:cell pole-organizing protein PopZ
MSSAPPPPAAPDGADPSMEEILASIRRILNDDESATGAEAATGKPPDDDDVLVLDESMIVPNSEDAVQGAKSAPAEPLALTMEATTSTSQAEPWDPSEHTDLVAPEAAAAAAVSVGGLMRALAAGRATQVYSGGPTLEDIVRAELRPLLKEWLDVNLPPMVERLVRLEIERVVGRAVP